MAVATRGGTRELLAVLQQPRGGVASAGVAAALRAVKAVARYKQAKQVLRRQGAGEAVMRLMAARVEAAGASDGTDDAPGSGDGDDSGEHAAGSGGQPGQATADQLMRATLSSLTDRADVLAAADSILQVHSLQSVNRGCCGPAGAWLTGAPLSPNPQLVPEDASQRSGTDSADLRHVLQEYVSGHESSAQLVKAINDLGTLAGTDAAQRNTHALIKGGGAVVQLLQAGVQHLTAGDDGDDDGHSAPEPANRQRVTKCVAAAIRTVRRVVSTVSEGRTADAADEGATAGTLGRDALPYLINVLNSDYAVAADALECIADIMVDPDAAMTVATASDSE